MKKTKLNETEIKDIIFEDYLLKNFPKNYKKVELNFDMDSLDFVNKLSKTLKVSDDAIFNQALKNYLAINK